MFIGLCRPHVFTGFGIRVKCDFCKKKIIFFLDWGLFYDLLTVMCWTAVS